LDLRYYVLHITYFHRRSLGGALLLALAEVCALLNVSSLFLHRALFSEGLTFGHFGIVTVFTNFIVEFLSKTDTAYTIFKCGRATYLLCSALRLAAAGLARAVWRAVHVGIDGNSDNDDSHQRGTPSRHSWRCCGHYPRGADTGQSEAECFQRRKSRAGRRLCVTV